MRSNSESFTVEGDVENDLENESAVSSAVSDDAENGVAEKTADVGAERSEAKEKKHLTVFGVEFVYLYLLGIAVAFLGWVVENCSKFFSIGWIDSRFHLLPFISPYALIPFAFHILLGNPDSLTFFGKKLFKEDTKKTKIVSNILSFLLISVAIFLGELVVGNAWDKLFGVKLWNYSMIPFHVTNYAGLISTVGFGTGAYLLFKFAYAPALKWVQKNVPHKVAFIICATLGVLIVLDTSWMCLQIIIKGEAPMYWSLHLRQM
jgi:hypothetical protein